MRILLQRVSSASVTVDGAITGEIGSGLLIFLGVGRGDTEEHADYLLEKMLALRIFKDAQGKMNLSLPDTGGAMLIVSQFTLYADISRGRRPGFDQAAPPELARHLYSYFVDRARARLPKVATGIFGADMSVQIVNDGPVTIFADTLDKFNDKSHAVK